MSQLCAHQLFMECLCPLLAKMWVRSYAGKMQYWQRPSWHVQCNQCQLLQDVQYVQYWGTAALWQLSLAAARHCWSQSLSGQRSWINRGVTRRNGAQQDRVQLSANKDDGVQAGDSGQSTEVIYRGTVKPVFGFSVLGYCRTRVVQHGGLLGRRSAPFEHKRLIHHLFSDVYVLI